MAPAAVFSPNAAPSSNTLLKKKISSPTLSASSITSVLPSAAGIDRAVKVIVASGNDLELLSVAAFRAIANAALVIADTGVSSSILDVVEGDLILLSARKPINPTGPVAAAILSALDQGHAVVRVKLDGSADSDQVSALGHVAKVVPQPLSKPDSPATLCSDVSQASSPEEVAELHRFKLPAAAESFVSTKAQALPSVNKVHGLISGENAASHVAYALTDMPFVYAVTPEFAPKDVLTAWAAEGVKNGHGRVPEVRVVSTQTGAGSVVHGAIAAGASTSVVASSLALKHMAPTLHQIAASRLPLVLHVSSQEVEFSGAQLGAISASFADVTVAAQAAPGLAVLASSTVQEVHDMAVVAHIASAAAGVPVVHFFDGTRTATEKARIATVEAAGLAALKEAIAADESINKSLSVSDIFAQVMTRLSTVFGKVYSPFEYIGPKDAESVVVAVGPAASLVEETLAASASQRVGLLKVRLLRPWSPAHLLEALPTTVRRIAVLDQSRQGVQGQLFLDVTSAFYSSTAASSFRRIPSIVSGDFAKGAEHFRSSAVKSFLSDLEAGKVHFGFAIRAPTDSNEHTDDRIHQAIFWDVQGDDTTDVAQNAARHVDAAGFDLVRSLVLRDDLQVEPLAATHLRFGRDLKGEVGNGAVVTSADFVAVHNVGVLASYDVVSAVRTGGVLLSLEKLLSASAKRQIVQKGIRVHVVDAAKVASNWTLFEGKSSEYVKLVLLVSFLKLCRGVDVDRAVAAVKGHLGGDAVSHNVLRTKVGALTTALRSASFVPTFLRLGTLALKKVHQRSEEDEAEVSIRSVKRHAAALPLLFKEAYGVRKVLRPDVAEDTFVVKVTENRRLTPETYERNVFHIEMDIAGTGLKYDIGEALGVYGHNDPEEVKAFLKDYGLEGSEVVAYERRVQAEDDSEAVVTRAEYRTVEQLLVQVIDLFGKPGKKFYQSLVEHATVMTEHPTYADVLRMFPSARPDLDTLLSLIPDIKPRHYSISSSMNVHPTNQVRQTSHWSCTRYLHGLRPGQTLTVSVKPSVMKLPPSHEQPVIMSGLGNCLGKKVGPLVLYFGARHRAEEYLYGEELEAYHADGLLTYLRLAFSRDQREKVYIQHKIKADSDMLADMILEQKGRSTCEALLSAFEKKMSLEEAEEKLEALKEEERYVLEVY
ncbi:hypothetical protein BC829DRAFT_438674 [Chytridium lagenaria]|nr:hypothetical protein BC829DRAFT_438674 [Chytridium lagenaria]